MSMQTDAQQPKISLGVAAMVAAKTLGLALTVSISKVKPTNGWVTLGEEAIEAQAVVLVERLSQ